MLVMAAASPFVAHLLARFGGQRVVMSGTLLIAAGCAGMAYTQTLFGWYCVWLITGIGMRLSLYDALFAALVNLYGQQARRTISRVTLAGGLASAVFWPLGDGLLHLMSWQEALRVYALFGLLSAALIRSLPRQRLTVTTKVTAPPLRNERRNGWLYAAFIALFHLCLQRYVYPSARVYRQLRPAGHDRHPVGIGQTGLARWRCWRVPA